LPYYVRVTNLSSTDFYPGHTSGKHVVKVLNNYYVIVRLGSNLNFYRGTSYNNLSLVSTLYTFTTTPDMISPDSGYSPSRQSIGVNYSSGEAYHYFREITLSSTGVPTVGSQKTVFSGSTYNRAGTGIWGKDYYWVATSYPDWVHLFYGITSFTLRWQSAKSYGWTRVDMDIVHLGNDRVLIVYHGYSDNNLYFADLDLSTAYKTDALTGLTTDAGANYMTSFQVAYSPDAGKCYLCYRRSADVGIAKYDPSTYTWALLGTIAVAPLYNYGLACMIDQNGILHVLVLDSANTAYIRYYMFDGTTITKVADIAVPEGTAWSWLGRLHYYSGTGRAQALTALARTDTGRLVIIEITPPVVYTKTLTESLSLSEVLSKRTSKALSDTVSLSDLIYKAISKSPFIETLSLSDILSIGIAYALTLIDSFSLSDSLVKRVGKSVSDSLSLSDLISRTTAKLLSDSLSLSDILSRGTAKSLLDSLSLTDMTAKAVGKSISDSILLSDVLTRGRILTDSLSLSDALSKAIGKRLLDNIAISDLLGKQVSVSLVDIVRLYATMDKRRKPPPPALATIPYVTPDGRVVDVKFSTLDHLMFGFILGISKLGFGVLLPRTSIFNQEDGKKNPVFLELIRKKVKGMIDRHSLTAWSYALYNRPDEMVDYHKSERTAQYDLLQTQRRFIEDWVANRISKVVTSKVMIRQYQNAVLQAVSWKAMRHKWGYSPFKITPEEKFKDWWVANWKAQGLDENILLDLYNSLESIIQALRDTKYSIGEGVKRRRRMLSGSTL